MNFISLHALISEIKRISSTEIKFLEGIFSFITLKENSWWKCDMTWNLKGISLNPHHINDKTQEKPFPNNDVFISKRMLFNKKEREIFYFVVFKAVTVYFLTILSTLRKIGFFFHFQILGFFCVNVKWKNSFYLHKKTQFFLLFQSLFLLLKMLNLRDIFFQVVSCFCLNEEKTHARL